MATVAHIQLNALQLALRQWKVGAILAIELSDQTRAHTELLNQLPPRYKEVLFSLLDRLESSALFTEERCSFSQRELEESLQIWIHKAQEFLDKPKVS